MANTRGSVLGMDRTERLINRGFYGKPTTSQRIGYNGSQVVPQMRSQSVSSGRFLSQSQTVSTVAGSQPMARTDLIPNSLRSQSQTNGVFHQMLESNRDKDLIERVDQKISKFEQILSDLNERTESTKLETIIRESVGNEFQKYNDLKQSLNRVQNENQILKEEVLRLRAIHSTELDVTSKQIQCLNEFKQQIIDCLPNTQIFESFIDSKNEEMLKRLSQLIQRIEDIYKNLNQNNFDSNRTESQESIEWFDSI